MKHSFESLIGFELHVQLAAQHKAFCKCRRQLGAPINSRCCAICTGRIDAHAPEKLQLNPEVLHLALRVALALDCTIHQTSPFDRKHYHSRDLPKGYQITQQRTPLGYNGHLSVNRDIAETGRIEVTRVHIEEDTARTVGSDDSGLIDMNRAGVGLVEIVTAPAPLTATQVMDCLREFRKLLMSIRACDGNMQQGSLRADINVSVHQRGQRHFSPHTEIKNLNSFRFARKAVAFEMARQINLLNSAKPIQHQTLRWNELKGCTEVMRDKVLDYHYVPEPMLAAAQVTSEQIQAVKKSLAPSPFSKEQRYIEHAQIASDTAKILTSHPCVSEYFDHLVQSGVCPTIAANFICNEMMGDILFDGLNAKIPLTREQSVDLLKCLSDRNISMAQAKVIYRTIKGTDANVMQLAQNVKQAERDSEVNTLEAVNKVLAEHLSLVERYHSGKKGLLGYFVGQVMQLTQGKADPERIAQLVQKQLG